MAEVCACLGMYDSLDWKSVLVTSVVQALSSDLPASLRALLKKGALRLEELVQNHDSYTFISKISLFDKISFTTLGHW